RTPGRPAAGRGPAARSGSTVPSRLLLSARARVETLEEREAVTEHLVVVLVGREKPTDRQVDPARLLACELAVAQIRLVDDLGQAGQTPVPDPEALDERLERAIVAVVTELGPRRVERDRRRREVAGRGEHERRLRIDEPPDQPRRGKPVHVRPRARHPRPASNVPQIQRPRRGSLRALGGTSLHVDGLPQPLDLGASGRLEEVELANALVLLVQAEDLRLQPIAG